MSKLSKKAFSTRKPFKKRGTLQVLKNEHTKNIMLKKRQAGGLKFFTEKKHDFGQFFHTHNIEKGTLHQNWVKKGQN